jgi:hypothetical protein
MSAWILTEKLSKKYCSSTENQSEIAKKYDLFWSLMSVLLCTLEAMIGGFLLVVER